MYFLELFNKIFCFDNSIGITFVYENKKWRLSKISLHEIEMMNLNEVNYLTINEAMVKVDMKKLKLLQNSIKKFYEVM